MARNPTNLLIATIANISYVAAAGVLQTDAILPAPGLGFRYRIWAANVTKFGTSAANRAAVSEYWVTATADVGIIRIQLGMGAGEMSKSVDIPGGIATAPNVRC